VARLTAGPPVRRPADLPEQAVQGPAAVLHAADLQPGRRGPVLAEHRGRLRGLAQLRHGLLGRHWRCAATTTCAWRQPARGQCDGPSSRAAIERPPQPSRWFRSTGPRRPGCRSAACNTAAGPCTACSWQVQPVSDRWPRSQARHRSRPNGPQYRSPLVVSQVTSVQYGGWPLHRLPLQAQPALRHVSRSRASCHSRPRWPRSTGPQFRLRSRAACNTGAGPGTVVRQTQPSFGQVWSQ